MTSTQRITKTGEGICRRANKLGIKTREKMLDYLNRKVGEAYDDGALIQVTMPPGSDPDFCAIYFKQAPQGWVVDHVEEEA